MKFMKRSRELVKLEELDLFYFLKRQAAIHLSLIALEMLALSLTYFGYGKAIAGTVQLVCAGIVGFSCVHEAVWARRAKKMIKIVEDELEGNEWIIC